ESQGRRDEHFEGAAGVRKLGEPVEPVPTQAEEERRGEEEDQGEAKCAGAAQDGRRDRRRDGGEDAEENERLDVEEHLIAEVDPPEVEPFALRGPGPAERSEHLRGEEGRSQGEDDSQGGVAGRQHGTYSQDKPAREPGAAQDDIQKSREESQEPPRAEESLSGREILEEACNESLPLRPEEAASRLPAPVDLERARRPHRYGSVGPRSIGFFVPPRAGDGAPPHGPELFPEKEEDPDREKEE